MPRNAHAIRRTTWSFVIAAVLASATAVFGPPVDSAHAVDPTTVSFSYTGAAQTWTVPAGVTSIAVDARGGQGGADPNWDFGGLGARATAVLSVAPGQVLNVYVGGRPGDTAGGFNGGGFGGNWGTTFGGGGASDVRIGGTALANRVVVAGGGGGVGQGPGPINAQGGSGGDPNGTAGGDCPTTAGGGRGATQSQGGAGGAGTGAGSNGTLGQGGSGQEVTGQPDGGGGGGGYYGGGGGAVCHGFGAGGGGGGGSSWASPSASQVAFTAGMRRGHGTVTISYPPSSPGTGSPPSGSTEFTHTGAPQWFTVPANVTAIQVELFGGQGGTSWMEYGGLGARVKATLPVEPGEVLQVNVGGKGGTNWATAYNGGAPSPGWGGSGGGASDVRRGGVTLAARALVAGGGGGTGQPGNNPFGMGGSGGDAAGQPGESCQNTTLAPATGGTQTAGGTGGAGTPGTGGAGRAGEGGWGGEYSNHLKGGGGGGGYYGGGGGGACGASSVAGGGAGGSSYAAPSATGATIDAGMRTGAGKVTISYPPALPAAPAAPAPGSATFAHTAGPQWWTVPAGVRAIQVDAKGAAGHGATAGLGGRVTSVMTVQPGEVLQVNVGGAGQTNWGVGFNGGGAAPGWGGGGGGASDVRQGGTTLRNRVVVAGGGGGSGETAAGSGGAGGAGGGLVGGGGGNATVWCPPDAPGTGGGGGTQSGGGAGGDGVGDGGAGSWWEGGRGGEFSNHKVGGGGGGGWHGGGGGATCGASSGGAGGGGGSSYSGPGTLDAWTFPGVRSGHGEVVLSWPVDLGPERAFGLDTYGELVSNVHVGSGNLVTTEEDADVVVVGPDLALSRTYNSLDTRAGLFGRGWSTPFDASATVNGTTGVVTVIHGDGRRESHAPNGDGTFRAPTGYVSRLANVTGGGWTLHHKDGSTWKFSTAGRLVEVADEYSHKQTLTYDGSNRLTTVIDTTSGRGLTLTYSGTGTNPVTVATNPVSSGGSPAPLVWRYQYTGGLLTKVCDPRNNDLATGICTTYAYTSNRLTSVTEPEGNVSLEASYRPDGRVSWTENGTNDRVTFTYGGGATLVTDARGNTSSYFWDAQLRTTQVTDEAGDSVRYQYDANGFRSRVTDPNLHSVSMTYDPKGNLLSETDGEGKTTYFSYDTAHNLLARRDARSAGAADDTYRTAFTYNSAGDKLTETSPATSEFPAGVTQTWTYTAGGENFGNGAVPPGLLRSSNPGEGSSTLYEYDAEGDLRKRTDPSGLVNTFAHDELGRAISTTVTWESGSATTTQTWDAAGNLRTVTEPATVNAAATPSITHQRRTVHDYDDNSNGWRATVSDIGGSASPTPDRVWTRDFDGADREWRTTDPEGGQTSRTFDPNGNVATATDAEGRTLATTYDVRNRPTVLKLLGFVDDPIGATAPRDLVLKRLAYDRAGRQTSEWTPAPQTGGRSGQLSPQNTPMVERRFEYDKADRLLSVTLVGFDNRSGVSPATRDVVLESHAYDAAGNQISETTGGGLRQLTHSVDQASRTQSTTLELGAVDRVVEFDYTAAGNVAREAAIQGASVVETRWTHDAAFRPIAEIVENGTTDLTTSFTYDRRDLRTAIVDPRGNVGGANPANFRTDTAYDAIGQVASITGPAVTVEQSGSSPASVRPQRKLGYDAAGNPSHDQDERGQLTRRSHDRLDRVVRIDHPTYTPPGGAALSPFEAYTYDKVGNLLTSRDRRGQTTQFTYDKLNRVVRQRDPQVTGQPSPGDARFEYDDAGHQTRQVDQTGAATAFVHDDLGRVRTQTEVVRQDAPAGSFATTFDHDDLGSLTYEQDAAGVTVTHQNNAASERTATTDALGKTSQFTYDAGGRLTASVDPLNRAVQRVYDQAGRQTATEYRTGVGGALQASEYFAYDAAGNLTGVRSARSASSSDNTYLTTLAYDAGGRLTSVTEPVNATTSYTTTYGYDAAGNLTRATDGRAGAAPTWHTWTPWGQPESTIEPSTTAHPNAVDRTFTTSYDGGGLPVSSTQPGGVSVTRQFDELGRTTSESGTGTGVPAASRAFGYDLAGRMTSIGHPSGTVKLAYDDRGLLLSTTKPASTAIDSSFRYDGGGRMQSRTDAAGTSSFTYTTRGELDRITDPLTGRTVDHDWNDAGEVGTINYGTTPAVARTLTYDPRGRLDTDTLRSGTTVLNALDYGYDAEGNLTSQLVTAPGNPAAGATAHTYTYDRSGRIASWKNQSGATTAFTYDGAGNRTTSGSQTFTYDARNRLLSGAGKTYTWSPRGVLASETSGTTTTAVTFDALGRQTAWGATTFTYDALDRIAKRGTTAFTYAGTELDPVAYGAQLFSRSPAGELTALRKGTASLLVGENRHGDLSWLLGPTGTVTDTRVWKPHGQAAGSSGSTAPTVGFQGDWTDPTTQQVWMGARWYDAATAGFTARDTVFGQLRTPISLNRYTYANGDPLEYFDPDGRLPKWAQDRIDDVKRCFGNVKRCGKEVVKKGRQAVRKVKKNVTGAFSTGRRWGGAGWNAFRSKAATVTRTLGAGTRTVGRQLAHVARTTVRTGQAISRGAAGVARGVGEGAVGLAQGVVATAEMTASVGAMAVTDPSRFVSDFTAGLEFIQDHPGDVAYAMVEPIVSDWRNGNYAKASGRLLFDGFTSVVGTKGLDKLAKLGRGARAVDNVADMAKALDAVSDVSRGATSGFVRGLARGRSGGGFAPRSPGARFVAGSDGVVTDLVPNPPDAISLGRFPAYVDDAAASGARAFHMDPDDWAAMAARKDRFGGTGEGSEVWIRNTRFLDQAIARRSQIRLASDPFDLLNEGSFFEREVKYLRTRGAL